MTFFRKKTYRGVEDMEFPGVLKKQIVEISGAKKRNLQGWSRKNHAEFLQVLDIDLGSSKVQGFPYWVGWRKSPPPPQPAENLLISPHLEKFPLSSRHLPHQIPSPPHQKSIPPALTKQLFQFITQYKQHF